MRLVSILFTAVFLSCAGYEPVPSGGITGKWIGTIENEFLGKTTIELDLEEDSKWSLTGTATVVFEDSVRTLDMWGGGRGSTKFWTRDSPVFDQISMRFFDVDDPYIQASMWGEVVSRSKMKGGCSIQRIEIPTHPRLDTWFKWEVKRVE